MLLTMPTSLRHSENDNFHYHFLREWLSPAVYRPQSI